MLGATITGRNNYFTSLTSWRLRDALAPKATRSFLPIKLAMPRSCHLLTRKRCSHTVCESKQNSHRQHAYSDSPLVDENLLLVIGIDLQLAPPEAFKHFQLYNDELPIVVDELARLPYVGESAILNTEACFEIYAVALPPAGVREIINWMAKRCGISCSVFEKFCYIHSGDDTVRHLLHTMAGIPISDAQKKPIGDRLGETKSKLKRTKGFGIILRALFEHASALHSRLRFQDDETLEYFCSAAVHLALRQFTTSSMPEPKVLVIRVSMMGILLTEELLAKGFGTINVVNFVSEGAPSIHNEVKGATIVYEQFENIASAIGKADIVFMCGGSLNTSILAEHFEEINRLSLESGHQKKILVDVSFEKNIADIASKLPFVQVFDIDDIQKLKLEKEYKQEMRLQAEALVDEQIQKFRLWVQCVGNVEAFKLFHSYILQNVYGVDLFKEDKYDFLESYKAHVANFLRDFSEACAAGADDNYIFEANMLLRDALKTVV